MIVSFLLWYFLISLVGFLAFPLTFRVFSGLTDRGYTFTRIFGLLVWGYAFWLLASLRILQNNQGGILLALILVVLISIVVIRKTGLGEITAWLQRFKAQMVITEALFLLAFAGWALVRAADPAVLGTEKPMELAFINAILRSPLFPPHDPWLSGYAISYYYFGYVMTAMLAKMTATPGAVAFNLASSLWFGLTAIGAYGVLFNLLSKRSGDERTQASPISLLASSFWGLLSPVFVLIVSNLEGFLEVLHARGIFWQRNPDGSLVSAFWRWLDIQELVRPPSIPFELIPERSGGIWWWRASRVLQDYDLAGQSREVIDEFPFFSFLLGDLHPHVLAMPFVLLAIGLALNVYYTGQIRPSSQKGFIHAVRDWLNGRAFGWSALKPGGFLRTWETWLAAFVLGSLAFLNTWDFPIYVGLFCGVLVFLRYQRAGWSIQRIGELFEYLVVFIILGVILYLPFYLGFSSQAGGIIPSIAFFTRGIHFWVMFGPLLLPVLLWFIWFWQRHRGGVAFRNGLLFAAGLILGLWLTSYLLGWLALSMPVWGNMILMGRPAGLLQKLGQTMIAIGGQFYGLQGSSDAGVILLESLKKRLMYPGTWLTLFGLLCFVWSFLSYFRKPQSEEDNLTEELHLNKNPDAFVLLLFLVGIGLTLTPEFLYLRDQFGWRMNTIFKFYFQAWILWAIAAAYASARLWAQLRSFWRAGFAVLWSLTLLAALVYPFFGLRMKGMAMAGGLTLDGAAYLEKYSPDEMEAIRFLQEAEPGVVAEAVGGSYSSFGRVSTLSGNPTVLGWPGHESQWRGGAAEMGSREEDIRTLYRSADWDEAKMILERYNIRYVYIGSQERSAYRVNEVKFTGFLQPVFANNEVVIYENSSALPLKE